MKKTILILLLALCLALTMLPAGVAADGTAPTVSGTSIYANGTALIIDGTDDTHTTVYIDANRNGTVDSDEKSLKAAGITGALDDSSNLSNYTIFGGDAGTSASTFDSSVIMDGGKVKDIYGGNGGNLNHDGSVSIVMNGGSVGRLLACGFNSAVANGADETVSIAIHGGTVSGDGKSNDDIDLFARNFAGTTSLLIDGGMINGNITVKKTGGSFVIKGGSILATYTHTNEDWASPTDGTNPVYKTTLTLTVGTTATANTAVSALTTDAGYTYGMKDVKTDSNGNLYVYLPAGKITTAATAKEVKYYGSVTTLNDNSATGILSIINWLDQDGDSKYKYADFSWANDTTNDGTEAKPYLIADAADLSGLAALVNGTGTLKDAGNVEATASSFSGKFFKVTADINLSGKLWTPIGFLRSGSARPFQGTFDGDGKTVSGMDVNMASTTNAVRAGLFGYVHSGTIKNLAVSGSVTATTTDSYNVFAGGIVGEVEAGAVINCASSASVNGTSTNYAADVGGVVGRCTQYEESGSIYFSRIINCYNTGTVSATVGYTTSVGGVVGEVSVDSKVINCYNAAAVSGTGTSSSYTPSVGGVIGVVSNGSTNTVRLCYWNGNADQKVNGTLVEPGDKTGIGFGPGVSTKMSETQMTTPAEYADALVDLLNENVINNQTIPPTLKSWTQSDSVNNGYPYFGTPAAPTYTYNTPDPITVNGVMATVTYSPESPQAADTEVTATVTLTGTATAAGMHTINLTSAADAGTITGPATKTKFVTNGLAMAAADKFEFTFTMPAKDVTDLALTHTFSALSTIEVDSTTHKTAYKVGDSLNVSGLTVKATMTDSTTVANIPVTPAMVSGFDSSAAAASQTLTITCQEKTTTYNISISAADPTPPAVTKYTITATAGAGGSISPVGAVSVNKGSDKSFTVKAGEGYEVDSVKVDGKAVTLTGASYTFTNVRADHTIAVTFKTATPVPEKPTVTVNDSAGGTATLSPDGTTLTITPAAGYHVADVKVNGVSKGKVTTLNGLKTGDEITVTFAKDEEPGVENPFTDVSENNWFYDDVLAVYADGLMGGVTATTFDPHGNTTRGMIVTILHRAELGSAASTSAAGFDDVAAGKYYTEAIAWGVANKIIFGYGNGLFGPDDNITREQLAAILYRYAQFKGQGFTGVWSFPLDFPDAGKVSGWAHEAMCWCVMNGIIAGNDDGTLAPKANAERCQVAAMIHRFTAIVK